ncbi:MAG: permease [Candidatus Micrarchaeia archaeon]
MDIFESFGYWVANALGIVNGTPAHESVAFFFGDIIKVFFLLVLMVFLVSIIRTFITKQQIRKMLGGKKEGVGNVIAAILGIPTPFCSCSAVPLFIGFIESGIPLGVTFSFLIASPLINEVAIALLLGMFGLPITVLYIGTGLVIAIVSGIIIGRLGLEGEVEDFGSKHKKLKSVQRAKESQMEWSERIEFAKLQVKSIVWKVTPYLFVGIGIGALIHGYAPVDFLLNIAGKDNPFAVVIAVIVGVPLYSNAAGILPVVDALMEKGMATGTALAFMMSVTALSLPEMIILRKILKPKLILIFAGILALSFILTGLLFNLILG